MILTYPELPMGHGYPMAAPMMRRGGGCGDRPEPRAARHGTRRGALLPRRAPWAAALLALGTPLALGAPPPLGLGLERCDLGGFSRWGDGLVARGSGCPLFAPVGAAPAPGRPFCLKALTQSGSTYAEATVSLLVEVACAAAGGAFAARNASSPVAPDSVRCRWRGGGETVFGYRRKHAPLTRDCAAVVVLRDPRFRTVSHLRYAAQQSRKKRRSGGADVPRAVFEWDAADALRREAAVLRRQFLDPFAGAPLLAVRYELLADPRYGPAVLGDVDAFLGLAARRGAPLAAAAAAAILRNTSYGTLRERCLGGNRTRAAAAAADDCPARREEELYRAHEPRPLEALVTGKAANLDAVLRGDPLLSALWGCFTPPPGAAVARPPTAASCPAGAAVDS